MLLIGRTLLINRGVEEVTVSYLAGGAGVISAGSIASVSTLRNAGLRFMLEATEPIVFISLNCCD
mgnify:CR=1 FL=1